MDFLKKDLAPLTQNVWQEIEEQAKLTLKTNLSARKFITVSDPKGWDFPGLPTGRLDKIKEEKNMSYGIREFRPTIEIRTEFELDTWEMDNLERGSQDIDLEPLEKAAEKIAKFEDQIVYQGFADANIKGLIKGAESEISFKAGNWAEAISDAVLKMKNNSIEGPYALVLGDKHWKELFSKVKGYPINRHIEKLIEGPIIYSSAIQNGLLVQLNSEDLVLTPGQDLSIGYQSHSSKKVKLFLTESFTFSIYEPKAVLNLKID